MLLKPVSVGMLLLGMAIVVGLQGFGETTQRQDPAAADSSKSPNSATEKPKEIRFDLGGGVKIELVLIQPGSFMMGDEEGDEEEKPVHKVTITKPFYIGKYEITQEQWQTLMGGNSSHFKGAKNPVDRVSWEDCQAFIKKLNEKFAASGATFSLPTEAQWEYACRAGSSDRYGFGNDASRLAEHGWFGDNSNGKTHPAGEKKPNAWGLYDMQGNLWEWCADWYEGNYYKKSPVTDPTGPTAVTSRVLRGGSWADPAPYCRASYRYCLPPWFRVHGYGFRVICER
jgi:formylglycine-generating enzyme required for sulfatase activity